MLSLVKHKLMEPLQEKRYNRILNMWIRCPFLIFSTLFSYLQFFLQDDLPLYVVLSKVGCMVLQAWNALYFTERVVGNYHVSHYKQTIGASSRGKSGQVEGGAPRPQSPAISSEEHMLPSIPGFQRKSISSNDLASLGAAEGKKDS